MLFVARPLIENFRRTSYEQLKMGQELLGSLCVSSDSMLVDEAFVGIIVVRRRLPSLS